MKTQNTAIIVALILLCFIGGIIIMFSSVTATDCVARVKGGSGTVQDPLRIEVEGNAGLIPFLDSLMPFRAVPSIELFYTGERFSVPGINEYFSGNRKVARSIYLTTIFLFIILVFWFVLIMAGKRIIIVDRQK